MGAPFQTGQGEVVQWLRSFGARGHRRNDDHTLREKEEERRKKAVNFSIPRWIFLMIVCEVLWVSFFFLFVWCALWGLVDEGMNWICRVFFDLRENGEWFVVLCMHYERVEEWHRQTQHRQEREAQTTGFRLTFANHNSFSFNHLFHLQFFFSRSM